MELLKTWRQKAENVKPLCAIIQVYFRDYLDVSHPSIHLLLCERQQFTAELNMLENTCSKKIWKMRNM